MIVRTKRLLAAAGLCAITLVVYANSFDSGFVLDNAFLLTEDRIQAATSANVRLIWNHTYWWPLGESGLYRPFTALTYLFNWAVLGNGDRPAGYHWINLLLHTGNVLLAYSVALRIIGRHRLALFAAGSWAVHPVLTEAVTNITGRAELLSGMSVLGGFLMYLKSTEAASWRKWAWLGGLMAITGVGVFSKESAVTVVGVIALYEAAFWRERRQVRGFLFGLAAMLLPVAAMLYQRGTVLRASQPAVFPFVDNPLMGAGFWTARLTALQVLGRYLGLIVWPATLSCDYSYPQIPFASGSLQDWIAWMAVAAALVWVALLYRWNRAGFFFGLFALVTLLPGSNLILTIGTVMAERLLYLPSFGLVACAVLGIDWIARRMRSRVAAPLICGMIALGFGMRTWARNIDWRTQTTLGEAALRACPRSFKVYGMLAGAVYETDTLNANLDRAIELSERGVTLLDGLPDSRNTWRSYSQTAEYYQKKGDLLSHKRWDGTSPPVAESQRAWQRAVELLKRSIAIIEAEPRPVAPKGVFVTADSLSGEYRALSIAYSRLGQLEQAYDAALKARDFNPMRVDTYDRLSHALRDRGRYREAAITLMEGRALTGEEGLDGGLVAIYGEHKELDPDGCAVVSNLKVMSRDPGCEAVRALRCEAIENASRKSAAIARKVRARKILDMGQEWKCGG